MQQAPEAMTLKVIAHIHTGDQIGFHRSVFPFIYLLLFPDCGRAAARARSSSAQQYFATR